MAYKDTLNLPDTGFPMRARLPEREPEIQSSWFEHDLHGQLYQHNLDGEPMVLHDGPPYANGRIHMGTALNKILKDIIVRHAAMEGRRAPYVPGWDTHGLPIEHKAIEELGLDRTGIDPLELRQACRQFALDYVDMMTEQFKRLGVIGDWENPYITLDSAYEAEQIKVFGEMVRKGYIYRGLRPVYWCTDCETALAEAEVEFKDVRGPSIYVSFPVIEGNEATAELVDRGASVVIWTTTPWTIPANTGIAVHPDADYQLVNTDSGPLLMAKERITSVTEAAGLTVESVDSEWKGKDLIGVVTQHPLFDRRSPLVPADHVTLDEGTGCVHTAPGHGREDFEVGQEHGLELVQPLDEQGVFTAEGGPFKGLFYDDANRKVTEQLESAGRLLNLDFITHSYAHCWRCKEPLIWRATTQWFASIDAFRDQVLRSVENVEWLPSWGEQRMASMVRERSDWCISRQRVWGVPIPIFYCRDCGEVVIDETVIERVSEMVKQEGSDVWWQRSAEALLPEGYRCSECNGGRFRKEEDIMDVWFDSGSSHASVLRTRSELTWPASIYLEGTDQYRGWFQSSLLTAVAVFDSAPYEQIITHGFVLDGQGRKMSKSLGNTISPEDVMQQYGADILRLWTASVDYTEDVRISDDILEQVADSYRKIRNTLRFMLGNLDDYNPDAQSVPLVSEDLQWLDRWLLDRLYQLMTECGEAYRNYRYHRVYQSVYNFCTRDLSSYYLDIMKDRLYLQPENADDRRRCQAVLYTTVFHLIRIVAPVLVHTADEVWEHLPGTLPADSVHLSGWPEADTAWKATAEDKKHWQRLFALRAHVSKALEKARNAGVIGKSLEAQTVLYLDEHWQRAVQPFAETLADFFIVSAVEVKSASTAAGDTVSGGEDVVYEPTEAGVRIQIAPAEGEKCSRCWHYSPTVGQNEHYDDVCDSCAATLQTVGT